MRLTSFTAALSASVVLTLALPVLANARNVTAFGPNLIVNGDAENGLGSSDGSNVSVPDWTTSSNFTAVAYGSSDYLPANSPGPTDRGSNFFAGGPSNASSSATQTISLASDSAGINTGTTQFNLSGWFGGYSSQDDYASLTATFYNSRGDALDSMNIGGISAADRNGVSGLSYRETSDFVPIGATSVGMSLNMTRLNGSYNDGYADNLSFSVSSVSAVPEPETYAMLLAGLGLMGFMSRRRQNS